MANVAAQVKPENPARTSPARTGPARIEPLMDTVRAGMGAVNDLILSRTGSDVDLIPELANHLIDRFERDTGAHIREHIEEISIATPSTFQRYTNAMRGNVYGYEQTPVDNVISRTLNKDKERFIKGLDFVGGATFRTVGVSSVISSGVKVAEDVWAEIGN